MYRVTFLLVFGALSYLKLYEYRKYELLWMVENMSIISTTPKPYPRAWSIS
jgi:hypothetical protein